jgi:hypothetical protein
MKSLRYHLVSAVVGRWIRHQHFSQELACSDVARALVPARVGTLADASFDTVSQPRTRVEMSLDTAGRVPAECLRHIGWRGVRRSD